MTRPETSEKPKKVIIIGAGPVGALAGLYFSHAGWSVTVYELRGGIYPALLGLCAHANIPQTFASQKTEPWALANLSILHSQREASTAYEISGMKALRYYIRC